MGTSDPNDKRDLDAGYLAQDSWSFDDDAAEVFDKEENAESPVVSKPKSAGFQGHKKHDRKFNQTVGMSGLNLDQSPDSSPMMSPASVSSIPEAPLDLQSKDRKVRKGELGSTVAGIAPFPLSQNRVSDNEELNETPSIEQHESAKSEEPTVEDIDHDLPNPSSEPPLVSISSSKPVANPHKKRKPKQSEAPVAKRSFYISLLAASVILVAIWFVPDILGSSIVFPFNMIGTLSGPALASALSAPVCGALTMAFLIAPFSPLSKAVLCIPVGLAALVAPLLLATPAVPMKGYIILIAAIIATTSAIISLTVLRSRFVAHIALALIPAALVTTAIYGIALGELSPGQLQIFKVPAQVYAATLILASALEVLLVRQPISGR